jgi:hypothetical protein
MNIDNLLFVEIETFKLTIMKQLQQIINHAEIKRNAIAKAKEIAGNDINKAMKLAKKFYSKMIE